MLMQLRVALSIFSLVILCTTAVITGMVIVS